MKDGSPNLSEQAGPLEGPLLAPTLDFSESLGEVLLHDLVPVKRSLWGPFFQRCLVGCDRLLQTPRSGDVQVSRDPRRAVPPPAPLPRLKGFLFRSGDRVSAFLSR